MKKLIFLLSIVFVLSATPLFAAEVNKAKSAVATCSSIAGSGWDCSKLNDENRDTMWSSDYSLPNVQSATLTWSTPQTITKIELLDSLTYVSRGDHRKTLKFEGTVDGTNWVTIKDWADYDSLVYNSPRNGRITITLGVEQIVCGTSVLKLDSTFKAIKVSCNKDLLLRGYNTIYNPPLVRPNVMISEIEVY